MPGKFKLTTFVAGARRPVVWPHTYVREPVDEGERIVVAPAEDPLGLMLDLAKVIEPDYRLHYCLTATTGSTLKGRYESPPLRFPNVHLFVEDFRSFLENDARHQVWISSAAGQGSVGYDHHGLIHTFGPLDEYETRLTARGLAPGPFEVPRPHMHHTHRGFDSEMGRLFAHWDWTRSDLAAT